jgi:cation:H+ antiporter
MLVDISLFLVLASIIFISGKRLSRYGDIIAEKSGLGKVWVGLLLMATVTSLPELITGISAVRIVDSPDLAVGNVLGSCVFNLAILSLLDVLIRKQPLFSKVGQSQVLAATLGTILLALVGVGLFLENVVILGWIGLMSFVFVIVYLLSIKLLHSFSLRGSAQTTTAKDSDNRKELRTAILWYAINATIVVAASLALPIFAENIAAKSGLGETFIGTLLLAASTSLPEISISLIAVRMGSVDIAVGNLFGSNIFNVFTLAIDDLFYTKGDLLKVASDSHIISIFSTIIMTSVAVAGLTFRSEKKKFVLAIDTFIILLVYFANIILLYYW